MNAAIVLAGGSGERAHQEIPKQFIRAGGRMMMTYAMQSILACDRITEIYVVSATDMREEILADVKAAKLPVWKVTDFAEPGDNRQMSVINGMQCMIRHRDKVVAGSTNGCPDTILIHDAARPYLMLSLIERLYDALQGHEGVMPVLPMKDTVYESFDGSSVSGLLERNHIYAGQAPELYLFGRYYWANMTMNREKIMRIKGSTEPAIMAGMDVAMIPGDEANIKITTEDDCNKWIQRMEGGAV